MARINKDINGNEFLSSEELVSAEDLVFSWKETVSNIHPGNILLKEYIEPMHMSVSQLANAIDVSVDTLNEFIEGKRNITLDLALSLARVFYTTPEFWLNMQDNYKAFYSIHSV